MKKVITGAIIALALLAIAAGCSKQTADTGKLKGEIFTAEKFTIVVPEGWKHMEIDGGVQIYKDSGEIISVHYRGYNMNESEAETQTKSLADRYTGTAAKQVDLLGKQFWATTFTSGGVYQTSYMRIENGVSLVIQCAGDNHDTDAEFTEILNSIEFQ